MKILFITNIPSPYRIDFFNELGRTVDLKVLFEAERNYQLNEQWYTDKHLNFSAVFLKKGQIEEKKINWKILNYISKHTQDLIVVTNYSYLTELLALLYIKIKRIPYCLEIDGGIIRNENIFLKAFKRFLIKNAEAYISPSSKSDEFLMHYGAEENRINRYFFTSLHNKEILDRVLLKHEKFTYKNQLEIIEDKMILSVGQFIYRKGFDVLIESAAKLSRHYGFYIVGGDPSQECLNLKRKYKLDNLHFIDFKRKEELKSYFLASDLFVLPTREDVWGLVINEAMACGLPVITTDKCVAGFELVNNYRNGFIVPSDDEASLAYRIDEILADDKLRVKMAQNSLEKIKNYTIENMSQRHIDIFKEMLTKSVC